MALMPANLIDPAPAAVAAPAEETAAAKSLILIFLYFHKALLSELDRLHRAAVASPPTATATSAPLPTAAASSSPFTSITASPRTRAGADDKPLRMVKTVLHELVKLRGTAIKGHLSMVPIDTEPQPIILAYIDLNLQTLAAARMLTPSGTVGQTHWGDAGSNSPAPTSHSADAQLKQELAAVFKKIGDKQTCTIGLYELYRITQLYPKVDIFSQLQNASEAFRTYIRDGLAQMEKNQAAGKTHSSIPMSTPPPLALNPSPKFAPLSPVHTKAFGMKPENNSVLPPSYMEEGVGAAASFRGQSNLSDYRQQLGEDRDDRYSSGAPGITAGTLDAIRERMKSIQATAAAGNTDAPRPLASMNGNMLHGVEHTDEGSPTHPRDKEALSGLQARMERLKSGSLDSQ